VTTGLRTIAYTMLLMKVGTNSIRSLEASRALVTGFVHTIEFVLPETVPRYQLDLMNPPERNR
jgi:hypothetical protein